LGLTVNAETLPSHDLARGAMERAAKQQVTPRNIIGILDQDKEGWRQGEVSAGNDRPETGVES
jgi:hypothetical protein